jgi:hypothetical protein
MAVVNPHLNKRYKDINPLFMADFNRSAEFWQTPVIGGHKKSYCIGIDYFENDWDYLDQTFTGYYFDSIY